MGAHVRAIVLALMLSACATPRERIRTVEVAVPVSAPCPRPADVVPMPPKPAGDLPGDAKAALAVMTVWALDLVIWGRMVEAQQAACSDL
jgi:hypothetical protein